MALNTDMLRLLQGSTIGEAIAPVRISATKPAILQLAPGTDVRAQVLGQLSNGQTIVRIAGNLLSMELPVAYRAGDTLPMTFTGSEPRPTFILSRQTVSGAPVSLSQLGRLLGQITQEQHTETPAQVNQLPRPNRLAEMPLLDSTGLAERLREVLSKSGIFYESHVAQWAEGKRQLAELLQEPQGALSRPELLARLATPPTAPPVPQQPQAEVVAAGTAPTPTTPTSLEPEPTRPSTTADPSESTPYQTAPSPSPTELTKQITAETPSPATTAPSTATGQQTEQPVVSPSGQATATPDSMPENTPLPSARPGQQASYPPATVNQLPPDPATLRLQEVYQRLAPEPLSTLPPPASLEPGTDPQPARQAGEIPLQNQNHVSPQPPVTPGQIRQPKITPQQEVSPTTDQPEAITLEQATSSSISAPQHDLADPQTFPLIRQQLATLNSGQLIWQGEAWPGQQLDWEVEERDARDHDQDQEGSWQTALRLELPNLGGISASLRIAGKHVNLHLQAADPATVSIMQARTSRLINALNGAGLDLNKLTINHDKTEPA